MNFTLLEETSMVGIVTKQIDSLKQLFNIDEKQKGIWAVYVGRVHLH